MINMRIAYLITGSGGSFYCGNCYRDMLYVRAIRKVPGISATAIPLYLPPDRKSTGNEFDRHVFFGAISLYLREKVPIFSHLPDWFDRIFDNRLMLKMASHQAGTTRTEGLEDLTLNMIKGENTFRSHEVERLVGYMKKPAKPDIIHLSNALIIGLAGQLKRRLDVRIICSILNEDDWIEEMAEPYRSKAWEMIASESVHIDAFVTPSSYYRDFFIGKTGISGDKIDIVPIGFEGVSEPVKANVKTPSIGYLCRMNRMNGFDKMVDAFIILKSWRGMNDLSLHVSGGYTGDDRRFVREQMSKLESAGFKDSVVIYHEFQEFDKQEFFNNIDLLSVPVRKHDGYGIYLLEANAAGVPVVQPATGAFPEIIGRTGGGIVYEPDSVHTLAENMYKLLMDDTGRKKLGEKGRSGVLRELSLPAMSAGLAEIYRKMTGNVTDKQTL